MPWTKPCRLMYETEVVKRKNGTRLFSYPELETPLGTLHFGGYLPGSMGTGRRGFRRFGMYAAVLICRGSGTYQEEQGYAANLGPGSVVLVFPEVAHRYWPSAGDGWDEIFVAFSGAAFDRWRAFGMVPTRPVWKVQDVVLEEKRLRDLLDMPAGGFAEEMRRALALHALIGAWLEARSAGPAVPPWVNKAALALSAVGERREIRVIAAACGMREAAFREGFRRWVGEGPSQFRRRQRLGMAAELLRRPNLTLAAIAEALGYHDAFHFSKRFKEGFGVSPSAFRKLPPLSAGGIIRRCPGEDRGKR